MVLQPLLVALMSEDNDVRQQAEKSLNDEWLQSSDQLLIQLVNQIRIADNETVYLLWFYWHQIRSFAVVLLRRVAFKTNKPNEESTTVWEAAVENTKQIVKRALLEGFEQEAVSAVRNKICDTIAEVAREEDAKSSIFSHVLG
jgi:importin-5